MLLKLITLALDTDSGCFPPDPLADLEGEVVSVYEHFFLHQGLPHILLLVHYRPYREPGAARSRSGESGLREELSEADRQVFDRLRAWRNARALTDNVPPYVILTNRHLAEISRRRPQSMVDLVKINGIGDAKSGRYGKDVLALVAAPVKPVAGPAPARSAPVPAP